MFSNESVHSRFPNNHHTAQEQIPTSRSGGQGDANRKAGKRMASNTVRCHSQQFRGMVGKEERENGWTQTPTPGRRLHISKFPIALSSPSLATLQGSQGALHLLRSYPTEGPAFEQILRFQVPTAVMTCVCSRQGEGGSGRTAHRRCDPGQSPSRWTPRRPWWSLS